MASLGAGVNLDAAVPALRLTYYDDGNADAQVDPFNFYDYDLHKIWACMGRAGGNGVMRAGFIEEGDPFNGWAAGTIESVVGGVPLAVQYWNTNVAYNPVGGIAVGDYTLYGALAPFDEIMQHVGAIPNVAPTYNTEYWNGAAWVAVGTLIKIPDYLQGGGFVNQRLKFTRPSNWAAATPAQLGLALANPGTYYYVRQFLTAPLIAGPTANVAYRDWLQGHIKHFFCFYGLKRGDDGFGSAATAFFHPGDFTLRFRDGFSLEGRANVGSNRVSWGEEITTPDHNRPTIGAGWAIVSGGRGPVIFGGTLAGGIIMGKPRHDAQAIPYQLRGSISPLDCHGTLLMGFGQNNVMGAAGSAAIRRITNSRCTIHPAFDSNPVDLGIVSPYTISSGSDAYVDRFVIDVRRTTTWAYAARSTVLGPVLIQGLQFTDDEISGGAGNGQFVSTGAGPYNLVDMDWGGPVNKVNSGVSSEFRKLAVLVLQSGLTTPIQNIRVRIRRTDGTVMTNVLTGADGKTHAISLVGIGAQNEDLFQASRWLAADLVETEDDAPFFVEVNPSDDVPAFNPTYESASVRASFPRAITFNAASNDWTEKPWQREDLVLIVGLAPAQVGPPQPEPGPPERGYTHRAPASTVYTHRP